MRVFLDTNVLVSAFATRGLCADLFRHVLAEHGLIVGEVVLQELLRVLRKRIKLPAELVEEVEQLLREQVVVPKSRKPFDIEIRDKSDRWILAAAVDGRAHVLVTGDRDLLDLANEAPLRIVDPRGLWEMIVSGRKD